MKQIYEMNEEEINNFIEKHIPIKKLEKDKYGEVFTSPILINKMLDLIPENVWSDPRLKWLDPSVGAGFFMINIFLRLMKGLQKWEKNDKKRSVHILTNMLYMVEINKKNCNICKEIFGENINIFCGDFLSDISFSKNNTDLFDCIIGNPPFNYDYGVSSKGKRIYGGKSKLYEHIFIKSYSMLNSRGIITFVVPDNCFSGNGSKMYKTIIQNNVPFVSFNPQNQYYFNKIQQPVCYFILIKEEKSKLTTIEYKDNKSFKIQLKDRPVNPIRDWTPNTEKLINKFISSERNNVLYNRGISINSYKGNKYKIILTPFKTLQTNNIKLAVGFGQKKAIIFSMSPDLHFKMDYTGKYGAGPNTFYICFDTVIQGKNIERLLNSKEYKILALATKTSRQFLKIAFIEHLKLTKVFENTRKNKKIKKNKTFKKS